MEIIDAQVHLYERSRPERPWLSSASPVFRVMGTSAAAAMTQLAARGEVTAEVALSAMDTLGIAAAVVVSSYGIYGFDPSYAFEAAAKYPTRFAVIAPINPDAPNVDMQIRGWRSQPGGLGVRLVLWTEGDWARLRDGAFNHVFAAAEDANVPLCIIAPGHLREVASIAESFPWLQLVVDHLGMATDGDPTWRALDDVIALARYPRIAMKITAAPVHSREPYPFSDLWSPLHRIIGAYGIERCMWGSDWTRVSNHTYAEGLRYMTETSELSMPDKERLLGQNLRRILRWT